MQIYSLGYSTMPPNARGVKLPHGPAFMFLRVLGGLFRRRGTFRDWAHSNAGAFSHRVNGIHN
jgi:hypothetical protein